jgi:hypothetical protein
MVRKLGEKRKITKRTFKNHFQYERQNTLTFRKYSLSMFKRFSDDYFMISYNPLVSNLPQDSCIPKDAEFQGLSEYG